MNKLCITALFIYYCFIYSSTALGSTPAQTAPQIIKDTYSLTQKPALVLLLRKFPQEDYFGFIFDMSMVSGLQSANTVKAIAIEKAYKKIINPELKRLAFLIRQQVKRPFLNEEGEEFSSSLPSCSLWATGQEGIEPIEVLPLSDQS